MSKQRKPKFRDTWVNQTMLGKRFNLSAVAVGKKLAEFGLRDDGRPTQKALDEEYCISTPMKDGTPFWLWNTSKVAALLKDSGLAQLSRDEQEARDIARSLHDLEKDPDQPFADKYWALIVDDMPNRLIPLVNRFLAEMGSDTTFEQRS